MEGGIIPENCEEHEAEIEAKDATRHLSPAALRALAEAKARRLKQNQTVPIGEIGGRGGQDPARYGDWEVKGRAIDF